MCTGGPSSICSPWVSWPTRECGSYGDCQRTLSELPETRSGRRSSARPFDVGPATLTRVSVQKQSLTGRLWSLLPLQATGVRRYALFPCLPDHLLDPTPFVSGDITRCPRSCSWKGGSAWESNPPGMLLQHPTDGFEDRGAHRDSSTPGIERRVAPLLPDVVKVHKPPL